MDDVASRLGARHRWEQVCIGRDLSACLLEVSPPRRPQAAIEWVRNRLGQPAADPRICSHIDLLFEPDLQLDPLMLLRQASRTAGIVVMWPGTYVDNTLAYAVPEHAHYRTWRRPEIAVMGLNELK